MSAGPLLYPKKLTGPCAPFWPRRGTKKGDISRFVEEAVQSRLFELTVESVKERNRPHDQNEILEAIDEALAGE